ncbi:MAG: Ig-like domain-containing protein, partial [Planctomycetota bacterium]|nr:Ig-like domain-containing protein [Planctomycetota bacterium]
MKRNLHSAHWRPPTFLWLLLLLSAACGREGAGTQTLELEFMRPVNRQGVYLNEQLILYFNRTVEPASVSRASVRVTDSSGNPARGQLAVQGKEVRFTPAAVLAPDLSDGGYRPDTDYSVRLGGFPELDGLRGSGGEPLSAARTISFHTVAVEQPRRGFVFADGTPEEGSPLRIVSATLTPDEPLRMTCAEPLDPSTLLDGAIVLVEASATGRRIPLRGILVTNAISGTGSIHRPAAVLELLAPERLKPGDYWLPQPEGVGLRDFGGNPVWLPSSPSSRRGLRITVVEAGEDRGRGELWLSLLDTRLRSPVALPGAAGTARWDGDGRIRIRYPAAAGTGSQGPLLLNGTEERGDLHGTSLSVGAGDTCDLGRGVGFRIMRSQGSLTIAGSLTRQVASPNDIPPMAFGPDETLSAWVRRAAGADHSWTVLVAGGDLFISGSLEVNTPLLLVAGGAIRVSGSAKAQRRQLWLLKDGGGLRLDSTASVAPLLMDPPERNPLVAPLTFSVSSALVPPWGRVERWLTGDADGRAGQGSWNVRYGQRTGAGPLPERWEEHPRALTGAGGLHLRVDLRAEPAPGQAWDPPEVD